MKTKELIERINHLEKENDDYSQKICSLEKKLKECLDANDILDETNRYLHQQISDYEDLNKIPPTKP